MKCALCHNDVFKGSLRQKELIDEIQSYAEFYPTKVEVLETYCLECLKKEVKRAQAARERAQIAELRKKSPAFDNLHKVTEMLQKQVGSSYFF